MADPTGLVSLGLGGAGRLLKIRSAIAHRKKLIVQLAERLDAAHALLLSEKTGDNALIYSDILSPLIAESVALLETINARGRIQTFKYALAIPNQDSSQADRLIKAFDQAPKDIELRCIHHTMKTLVMVHSVNPVPPDPDSRAKIRNLHFIFVTFACFLSSGEASVTPQRTENTTPLLL